MKTSIGFRISEFLKWTVYMVAMIAVIAALIFFVSAIAVGIYREVTGTTMLGSDVQIKIMVTESDMFYDLDKNQVYRFQDGSWVATTDIVTFHEIPQWDDARRYRKGVPHENNK